MKQGVFVILCLSKNDVWIIFQGIGIGISLLAIEVTPVCADEFDTVNYTATAGVNYDSNVFRLPNGIDPQTAIGKSTESDYIQSESMGINLDKKYSNQDVQLNANATYIKFNTFSYLNYFNTAYNGVWNWNLTKRLNGSLSDNRTQTLNSFTDVHTYSRNLTTVDTRRMDADWWFESSWHALLGVSDSKTTTSLSVINNQSYTASSSEWGMKYVPADGSSISLMSREIQNKNINSSTNYLLLIDTQNNESQKEMNFNWLLSGKSVLSGNLQNIKHRYPTFYQRDYGGTQGGLKYLWGISAKTNLEVSMNRNISGWYDFASSYYTNDTASISPSWQISTKTNLHLSLTNSKANYFGPIVTGTTARQDTSQSEQLGLDWTPLRSVKLSTSVQSSRRVSNYSGYGYSDKGCNLSLQITF